MEPNFSQKYRLGERIGAGGMAEVFRGHIVGAAGFEREIAVKRIRPDLAGNRPFVEMFIREAALAARLSHPNIVQVFDFESVGGTYFIAMEFVRGWDLRSIEGEALYQKGRVPLDVGVGIVINVLDGLAHAHGLRGDDGQPLGIIHRDVSPHNVLVSAVGDVKLTDFGIARASFAAHQTESGARKGKLFYMSPEQIEGKPIDHRADLFSAGVMLFEVLAGYRPFDGKTDYAVMANILRGHTPALPADLPAPLVAIVRKSLSSDPAARYQSASQMRDALRAFCVHHNLDIGKIVRRQYLAQLFGERADALLRAPGPGDSGRIRSVAAKPGEPISATQGRGGSASARDRPGRAGAMAGAQTPTELAREARAVAAEAALPPRPAPTEVQVPYAPTPMPAGAPPGGRPPSHSHPSAGPRPLSASHSFALQQDRRIWRIIVVLAATGLLLAFAATAMVLRGGRGGTGSPPVRVLLRLGEAQGRWFQKEVVAPFRAREKQNVELVSFQEAGALIDELEQARRGGRPPDLVRVPLIGAHALAEAGYVAPLEEAAERAGASGEVAGLVASFDPQALGACEYATVTGRAVYYLPAELESRVMVYRPSRVRMAASHWTEHRVAIERELKALGLGGLPQGYTLEADPWRWDLFDVLVAGYVWAHDGSGSGGHVARRSLKFRYFGAVAELLDMAAAIGAQPADFEQPSEALVDALEWDLARRALGVYHKSVFDAERGASGVTIMEAMSRGELDLAMVSQRDALLMRGNPRIGLAGKFPSDDLDVAPPPDGVSLRLGADGRPLRHGGRRGLLEGWVWGFARGGANPAGAWRLALTMTSREVEQAENAAFQMPPKRRDCCPPPPPSDAFARRLFEASRLQLAASQGLYVPRFADYRAFETYRDRMLEVWDAEVLRPRPRGAGSGAIDREALRRALARALGPR